MITFIAPAFNEPVERRPLIESLLNQTNPNWECIVYHNGHNSEFKSWVESYNDPRVIYKESINNTGAWGCYNRLDALDTLTEGYVIQTSIQDIYEPTTVEEIVNTCERCGMVIWNSTNHLIGGFLNCEVKPGHIDWGNAAVNVQMAQKASILYPEEFMADWLFFKTLTETYPQMSICKIDEILTHHK